jgi:DNA-binding GntR family transcriptional regulator
MTGPRVPSWIRPGAAGEPPFVLDEWPYLQVADRLEDRIRAGEFGADGQLPTTGELMTWYGQKPGVVSHAYKGLMHRGLVRPRAGNGYFVRPAAQKPGRDRLWDLAQARTTA